MCFQNFFNSITANLDPRSHFHPLGFLEGLEETDYFFDLILDVLYDDMGSLVSLPKDLLQVVFHCHTICFGPQR